MIFRKNTYINLPLLSFLILTKETGKLFFFIVILFVLLSNSQLKGEIRNMKKIRIIIPFIFILILVPFFFSMEGICNKGLSNRVL